jgi:hypothetical protein
MFDLEQSIAEWRQQMIAAGIKTPVPLEELENHLREDFEQRARSGLSTQQAFEDAVQRMGRSSTLTTEFKKVGRTKEGTPIMPAKPLILVGVLGVICMVVGSCGHWWILRVASEIGRFGAPVNDDLERWNTQSLLVLCLGVALLLASSTACLAGRRRKSQQKAVREIAP